MEGRVRQLDETTRVFYAPVAEDVARFVGVETLVMGRVVGRADGVTAVEAGGRGLEGAAPPPPGAHVRVGIPPPDGPLTPAGGAGGGSSARNTPHGTAVRGRAALSATP